MIIYMNDYADDLSITLNNDKIAEVMIQKIENIAKVIGLQVYTDKTEYMSINRNKNTSEIQSTR